MVLYPCFFGGIYFSVGIFFVFSWLLIGPYLLYQATKALEKLRVEIEPIMGENISLFDKCERNIFSEKRWIFVLSMQLLVFFLTIIIPIPQNQPLGYRIFYIFTWQVVANLASLGIWGIFHLSSFYFSLLKVNVILDTLHPDKFGGINFLAEFSTKVTILYSTGAFMVPLFLDILTIRSTVSIHALLPFATFGVVLFSFSILLYFLINMGILSTIASRAKKDTLDKLFKKYRGALKRYDESPEKKSGISIIIIQNVVTGGVKVLTFGGIKKPS